MLGVIDSLAMRGLILILLLGLSSHDQTFIGGNFIDLHISSNHVSSSGLYLKLNQDGKGVYLFWGIENGWLKDSVVWCLRDKLITIKTFNKIKVSSNDSAVYELRRRNLILIRSSDMLATDLKPTASNLSKKYDSAIVFNRRPK